MNNLVINHAFEKLNDFAKYLVFLYIFSFFV
jgi:hypothetical protein